MATDTAPPPTSRRHYWQLPTFAAGVAAAVAAYVAFPPPPADPAVAFARDLSRLRETLDHRPLDAPAVETLAATAEDLADQFPQHAATAKFLAGSGHLALAEAEPGDAAQWAAAARAFAAVDPAGLPEVDRPRFAFRRAKADAATGAGDAAQLAAVLDRVPPGEEIGGEWHRLLADTLQRVEPFHGKRYREELKAYLSGPARLPAAALDEYRVRLADAHRAAKEPEEARRWLNEIGTAAGDAVRARAGVTLGQLAEAEGKWADAVKHYEAAVASAGLPAADRAATYYRAGEANRKNGATAAAAAALYEKARQDPGPVATAAAFRLAEVALDDGRLAEATNLLAAVVKGVPEGEPFVHPMLAVNEVRDAFKEAAQKAQDKADYALAARVTETYAKVADPAAVRELRADVNAAWAAALQKVPATAKEAAAKFQAAAVDYEALARTNPGRGDLFRRASACLRSAGDTKGVVALADLIAKTQGVSDEIIAAAWVEKGDALLTGNQFPEAVAVFQQAILKPGPAAAQARVKLGLAHLDQARAKAKAGTADAVKEAAGLRDLGQKLLAQVANAAATGPAERDAQQQALFELGKLLLDQGNVPDAEARFRQLVQTHPTGPVAGQGKLYLGSCLLLLGRGDNQDGRPPADADRKLGEALKIFEELATTGDPYLRPQAGIRQANALLLLKRYDDMRGVCDALAGQLKGTVEELIVLNMLWSAHYLAERPAQATEVAKRVREAYAKVPADQFHGAREEYTRAYWDDWFQRVARVR